MAPPAKKGKIAGQGNLRSMFGAAPKDPPAAEPATATEETTPSKAPLGAESPAVTPTVPAPAPPAEQPTAGGMSEDVRLRIEESRRRAMERQQAKKRASAGGDPERDPEPHAAEQPPAAALAAAPVAPAPAAVPEQQLPAAQKTNSPAQSFFSNMGRGQAKSSPAKGKAKAQTGRTGVPGSPAKSSGGGAAAPQQTPEKMAQPSLPQQKPVASPPVQDRVTRNAPPSDGGEFVRDLGQWQQYIGVYRARLDALKGAVLHGARALWGGMLPPDAFRTEISGHNQPGAVIIVGLLYKELRSRSCVIDQFKKNPLDCKLLSESTLSGEEPGAGSLCSDEDRLFLEDGSMRLELTVSKDILHMVCTGLVVAVHGTTSPDGGFVVTSVAFSQLPAPRSLAEGLPADRFVAFVSGLAAPPGQSESERCAAEGTRARLIEFVTKTMAGKLERVIVCGGVLSSRRALGESLNKEALAVADGLLERIAESTQVRVMPGQADPTNYSLPQKPMHPYLFRKAFGCDSVRCVSNPYSENLESSGMRLLGHSGQPVVDILRCTRGSTPISALKMCLEALHLAPTAPDTLATPPFEGKDPFVIDEVPHVLFSGGHARAANEWILAPRGKGESVGTQCVCVPSLQSQPAVVLVSVSDPRDVRVQELGAA